MGFRGLLLYRDDWNKILLKYVFTFLFCVIKYILINNNYFVVYFKVNIFIFIFFYIFIFPCCIYIQKNISDVWKSLYSTWETYCFVYFGRNKNKKESDTCIKKKKIIIEIWM